MNYTLYNDGTFDIACSCLELKQAYPAINGRPLHPLQVIVQKDHLIYHLDQGEIRLQFTIEDSQIAISCQTKGLSGAHDISIIDHAEVVGADKVFIQGLGMEGPSGIYDLTGSGKSNHKLPAGNSFHDKPSAVIPDSYGITGLVGKLTSGAVGNSTNEINGDSVNSLNHRFAERDCCLVAYTMDQSRFSSCFRTENASSLFRDMITFTSSINMEGTTKEAESLPTLYIREGEDLARELSSSARIIADHMHTRRVMPPAFHWCSWYYLYQNLDQTTLKEYVDGFRREPDIPFSYIQIDAGYCPSLGDWLLPNHRFPKTLKEAAETIIDAGYKAGVWIGPFMVGDQSDLYHDHPDWILKDLDGRPLTMIRSYTEPKVWGNRDSNYYILDASHPGALKYLKTVFETFRSWGFTYFKTDFMMWNCQDSSKVRRYDPSLTSVEILRNVLSVIRGAIGEDSYLLGCIAPFMPCIGYVDGMRIAGDVGAQWEDTFGPVNLLRELPADNYFQNIFWQNDPDSVLLRDFDTMLTPEETRSLALLQAVSGGIITTSDPVHLLSDDRKELLRFIRPDQAVKPDLPFYGSDRDELIMVHQLAQGNLLYILNPTEGPVTSIVKLDELFGDEGWYQYSYQWDDTLSDTAKQEKFCSASSCQEKLPPEASTKSDLLLQQIAPHDSALVFITREPLSEKPKNLWRW
ncbi:MAG: alpha-galactosidase [Eubacterium sp.]|nr:alpha-galactosidase [Eubacterium sp.]